jgi:hypothetical protein
MDIRKELKECLTDCGFTAEKSLEFLDYERKGNADLQLHMLRQRRKEILQEVHRSGKQVDCIDYMIHEIHAD